MARSVFTIVTPIKTDCRRQLEDVLAQIKASLSGNPFLRLSHVTFPEIHFASFVIFDDNTLVFENSVDGPAETYLLHLAKYDGIDTIYSNCEGYGPSRTRDERFSYLSCRRHFRKPQLHHVSTPYRTAPSITQDADVRRRLDEVVDAQPSSLLLEHLGRPTQGIREYWNWEVLKPWVAVVAVVLLWVLERWLFRHIDRSGITWSNALIVFDMLLLGGAGLSAALGGWHTALPPLRNRVKPGIAFALGAAGVGWVVGRFGFDHPVYAVILVCAYEIIVLMVAREMRYQCTGERIATIRVGSGEASPARLWRDLKKAHQNYLERVQQEYARERPGILQRLWNWRYWVAIYVGTAVPIWYLIQSHHPLRLWAGLVLAFFLEKMWLTILVGWPSRQAVIGWPVELLLIVIAVTAAEAAVIWSLILLNVPWYVLTLLVLLAWFTLWGILLDSPTHELRPPDDDTLKTIEDAVTQEDCGVQNHMALMAYIGASPSSDQEESRARRALAWAETKCRIWSLKIFLWTLDRVFYQALLPDAWRGKLFGIPTVHSAQWTLLPDGRYLFLSNYDHSFTRYLDDFGIQIATGIQKIWGQSIGSPGLKDLEEFKAFVRTAMVPYQVWYRAYPDLTVRQVWNNENIRVALARKDDEERVVAALRRFGAAPKIVPGIQHGVR